MNLVLSKHLRWTQVMYVVIFSFFPLYYFITNFISLYLGWNGLSEYFDRFANSYFIFLSFACMVLNLKLQRYTESYRTRFLKAARHQTPTLTKAKLSSLSRQKTQQMQGKENLHAVDYVLIIFISYYSSSLVNVTLLLLLYLSSFSLSAYTFPSLSVLNKLFWYGILSVQWQHLLYLYLYLSISLSTLCVLYLFLSAERAIDTVFFLSTITIKCFLFS